MFNRREEKPDKPTLIGEDFDIYPDLGGRPPKSESNVDEVDNGPDEDPEPTDLQKKIAAIPEEKWIRYQTIGGIALGLLSSAFLTVFNQMLSNSLGFIIAVALALLLPNVAERQFARKMPRLRNTLLITLAAGMAIFMLYGLVINPGYFDSMSAS